MYTYAYLKDKVVELIGENNTEGIIDFAQENLERRYLYGDTKAKDDFPSYVALLAAHKDLYHLGMDYIKENIPRPYRMSKESILNNIKAGRRSNYHWAKSQLKIPSKPILSRRGKTVDLRSEVPKKDKGKIVKIHLWMDSVDFRMKGRRSMSKKDHYWSYKENGPGRRFMVVTDGKGTIRKIWGPYSSKTYDVDFLRLQSGQLTQNLAGLNVEADCHFEVARKDPDLIPGARFLVPYPQVVKKKRKLGEEEPQGDPLETNYNTRVREVRPRVESPFGLMKQRFEALAGPFNEDDKQLRYLVTFASVVENNILERE